MADPVLRFLHASDLRLHEPLTGPVDPPASLLAALLDAPYRAAERVFDAALAQQVDFVLLTGDVADPAAAGPYALVFLQAQLTRLDRAGIATYWLAEGQAWPTGLPLPGSVERLSGVVDRVHRRGESALARIMTAAAVGREPAEAGGSQLRPPPVVVLGGSDPPRPAETRIVACYWALGGSPQRRNALAGPTQAHDPGSPQGRTEHELGAHGCTLVEIDSVGEATLRILPTDLCRWVDQTVELERPTSEAQIERLLHDRATALRQSHPGREVLVTWTVRTTKAAADLRWRDSFGRGLVEKLNQAHAAGSPAVYTCGLELESPESSAVEPEAESFLGQFLRAVEQLESPSVEPTLLATLPEGLAERLDPQRVLRRTARLGRELLTAEEPAR